VLHAQSGRQPSRHCVRPVSPRRRTPVGPFRPDGPINFCGNRDRVSAHQTSFLVRLEEKFRATVPAARRRIFFYEWSLARCPHLLACTGRSLAAGMIDPTEEGLGYSPRRMVIGSLDEMFTLAVQEQYTDTEKYSHCMCPCMTVRKWDLPSRDGQRHPSYHRLSRPLHGVYIDVWDALRPAAGRAIAWLRAHGLINEHTVIVLSPFNPPPPGVDVVEVDTCCHEMPPMTGCCSDDDDCCL
jgi:hypothetical protein